MNTGKEPSVYVQLSNETITRNLRAITSHSTDRYDKTTTVLPSHTTIQAGSFIYSQEPRPAYLPPQWSFHIHPEGQLYFYRDSPLRIVTEAYIYHPETMERICYWAKWIEKLLVDRNITISADVELFLQLDELNGSEDSCAYYLVDHASRVEFWIDPLSTEDLGLSPVVSDSHLKIALEDLYWCHVEFFPTHLRTFSLQFIDDLICVFIHARADRMTSRVSTFPYTEQQCANFLDLLKASRDHINESHTISYVARLWSVIIHHRFITHYGQEHSRLCRDQSIVQAAPATKHQTFKSCSRLLWSIPHEYLTKFDDLFVDNLVYVDQWHLFMASCLRAWKETSLVALIFLLLDTVIISTRPHSSLALVAASASMFIACTVSTVFLVHRHEALADGTASEAVAYLNGARSEKSGFQLSAIAFSLPRAFFLWGLCFFLLHWIVSVAQYFGLPTATALSVFTLALVMGIRSALTSSRCSTFSWLHVFARIRGYKEAVDVSKV